MNEIFLQKTGKAITLLATDLIQLKEKDRLPIISEFVERYELSRGTVQNALQYLKDEQAIVCESKGHLGSFIVAIDYEKLQQYVVFDYLRGTMPLPYSRLYEGFATGLYENFEDTGIKVNMAYVRGAKERIRMTSQGIYQFSVVSKFAAETAIAAGEKIEIVMDFGAHSYLSEHILLLRDPQQTSIQDGMKIGIDYSSYDQQKLTEIETAGKHVELIEIPGHQLIYSLTKGKIDAGIWNYDEIRDKNVQNMHYQFLGPSAIKDKMSTAVIIFRQNDEVIKTILKTNLNQKIIRKIQKEVVEGTLVPRY